MIKISLSGWFQCRLATDPDDFAEKRGVSGWTFAVAGEPDLDRVIRFQDPVAPRSHGPAVGVKVTAFERDGAAVAASPLVGAPVDLLGGAVFEGRNGDIATSANEPIVPFSLRIGAGAISIAAADPMDLSNPAEVQRRQPVGFESNSAAVAAATGITDRVAFRAARKAALEHDLQNESDATRRAALAQRIAELGKGSIRVNSLGFQLTYGFDLRGAHAWTDPTGALGPAPRASANWRVDFWLGAWDADALCGFLDGSLSIS